MMYLSIISNTQMGTAPHFVEYNTVEAVIRNLKNRWQLCIIIFLFFFYKIFNFIKIVQNSVTGKNINEINKKYSIFVKQI